MFNDQELLPRKAVSNDVKYATTRREEEDIGSSLKSTGAKPVKSNTKKNILDMLMEPFDVTEKAGVGFNEDKRTTDPLIVSVEDPSKTTSTNSRRSVRFSDELQAEQRRGGDADLSSWFKSDHSEAKELDSSASQKSGRLKQRPHTAPGMDRVEDHQSSKVATNDPFSEFSRSVNNIEDAELFTPAFGTKIRRPLSLDSFENGSGMLNTGHFRDPDYSFRDRSLAQSLRMSFLDNNPTAKTGELEAKIKRLDLERGNAKAMLDLLKKQHQEEILVIEKAAGSKLQMMEESYKRRENRLKEELQYLEEQNRERLATLEQQRDQLVSELTAKLNEVRKQSAQELLRIGEVHDQEITTLKAAHERAVAQIRTACQRESQVLEELQPNTESLKRLLEQLSTSATELGRAEQDRLRELSLRQEYLARREESIRSMEERLAQREEHLDREQRQITDTLVKLEFQMKENAKMLSEHSSLLWQKKADVTDIYNMK
ncbi:unnamed protein product [Dicrocoelium dendriticum]|nr:unnamed protein product [Dicrocoelium dendriticum]